MVFFFSMTILYAHPHVFIEGAVTFEGSESALTGIRVTWAFDTMFSQTLIADYDKNDDGRFSRAEEEMLEREAFKNIKRFHYFSYLSVNGKKRAIETITEFSATIRGKQVVYCFVIPLALTAGRWSKKVVFAMYDNTYFVAMRYATRRPIRVKGLRACETSYRFVEEPDKRYYGGTVVPTSIIFTFAKE